MKDKTSVEPFLLETYERHRQIKLSLDSFIIYNSVGQQLREDNLVKLQIRVLKRV